MADLTVILTDSHISHTRDTVFCQCVGIDQRCQTNFYQGPHKHNAFTQWATTPCLHAQTTNSQVIEMHVSSGFWHHRHTFYCTSLKLFSTIFFWCFLIGPDLARGPYVWHLAHHRWVCMADESQCPHTAWDLTGINRLDWLIHASQVFKGLGLRVEGVLRFNRCFCLCCDDCSWDKLTCSPIMLTATVNAVALKAWTDNGLPFKSLPTTEQQSWQQWCF